MDNMQRGIIRLVVLALLAGTVVMAERLTLCGASIPLPVSFDKLPLSMHQVESATERVFAMARRVQQATPAPVLEYLTSTLLGASSAVLPGRSLTAAAAGGAAPSGTSFQDAVLSRTASKFFYSLGSVVAQLGLIKLLYVEPCGNRVINRWNRLLSSPVGWLLFTALVAVPNGVVEIAVLVVLLFKIASPVYTPAIITGTLLRPYLVAVVRSCPCLTSYVEKYVGAYLQQSESSATAELLLWGTVIAALLFLTAGVAFHDTEDDDVLQDSE